MSSWIHAYTPIFERWGYTVSDYDEGGDTAKVLRGIAYLHNPRNAKKIMLGRLLSKNNPFIPAWNGVGIIIQTRHGDIYMFHIDALFGGVRFREFPIKQQVNVSSLGRWEVALRELQKKNIDAIFHISTANCPYLVFIDVNKIYDFIYGEKRKETSNTSRQDNPLWEYIKHSEW